MFIANAVLRGLRRKSFRDAIRIARRISIIGHSEGTIIAPRVAIDNSTKVKNIILMGTAAYTTFFLDLYYSLWGSDRRISKKYHVFDFKSITTYKTHY